MAYPFGIDIYYGDDAPSTPEHVDFEKMAAAGAKFVIIKSTDTSRVDLLFKDHYRRAKDAGLLVGAYHFLRWNVQPESQMSVFSALIKDYPCDIPPTVDYEWWGGIPDPGRARNWLNICRVAMTKATGKEAMIYTGVDFWKNEGSTDAGWKRSPLWLAQYFTALTKADPQNVAIFPAPPRPWERVTFWQYTSHGDGLKYGLESKDADINLFNGDENDLLKFCGLAGDNPPPPPDHPLTLEDVGLWIKRHEELHKLVPV